MKRFLIHISLFAAVIPFFYLISLALLPGSTFKDITTIRHYLTNSMCLNLQLNQLRDNQPEPEVLFIGSSMSLNNMDAANVQEKTGLKTYNLGSWGQMPDANIFLIDLVNKKNMKCVFMPLNIMDFREGDVKINDSAKLALYVRKQKNWRFFYDYIKNFTAITHEIELYASYRKINSYTNVDLDKNGSVLFHPKNFVVTDVRWNAKVIIPDAARLGKVVKEVRWLKEDLSRKNIKLFILVMPLRADKQSPELDTFWQSFVRKVGNENIVDLRTFNSPELFCDYSHLYDRGARLISDSLSVFLNSHFVTH